MRGLLVILIFLLLEIIYSLTVYFSESESEVILSEKAVKGKLVYQKYNCTSCHQIYGLGGYLGPDLTNAISRIGKKGAETFIKNGTSKMPNLHLKQEEIQQVIAFLEAVDKTGKFPLTENDVKFSPLGTFNRKK